MTAGWLRAHAEHIGILEPLPEREIPLPILDLEITTALPPEPWPLDRLLAAIGRRLRGRWAP